MSGDAFCLCGAQAGYPHDRDCPYPLFKDCADKEFEWEGKYLGEKSNRAIQGLLVAVQQLIFSPEDDTKRAKDVLRQRVAEVEKVAESLHDFWRRALAASQASAIQAVPAPSAPAAKGPGP